MSERRCNECTLCCKLLPVRELKKLANTRCEFQRASRGCVVYQDPKKFPRSCGLWSCNWLADPHAKGLHRPDRSHYVIDPSPDYIEIDRNDGSPRERASVLQVWVDPNHKGAYRDPALLDYLQARYARLGQVALIRYSSRDAFVLVPPAASPTGDWYEHRGSTRTEEHSMRDILDFHAALPR